jgi:hypothetical protein
MAGIPEMRSEWIWAILAVGFLIPALVPLGVPFPMSPITLEIYELIENLPEGSLIVMGGSGVIAFDIESSPGMIAAVRQMERNGLKLVTCPLGSETPQYHKFIIDAARVDVSMGGSWVYGENYALLPYLPGGDAALVAYLDDVKATVSVDMRGTPISEIPIFDDFNDYNDIDLWICPHWGFVRIVRIATGEYDVTAISFAQSTAYAFFSPFMQAYPGKVYMTNGYLGGAQYEKLNNMKGLGHRVQDSYTIVGVLIAGFIVLGNVTMLTQGEEED